MPTKHPLRSKTLWTAVLILLLTLVEAYLAGELTRTTATGVVSAALMALLRTLTSSGILWGSPAPKAPEKGAEGQE